MQNINKRLRDVSRRVAKIDRGLGFLDGQLYFKPTGQDDWIEVEIFSFDDGGDSDRSVSTGEAMASHGYSCRIDRDWLDQYRDVTGTWAVRVAPNQPLLNVEKESESTGRLDTFGVCQFRITQTIPKPPSPDEGLEAQGGANQSNRPRRPPVPYGFPQPSRFAGN